MPWWRWWWSAGVLVLLRSRSQLDNDRCSPGSCGGSVGRVCKRARALGNSEFQAATDAQGHARTAETERFFNR